MSETTSSFSAGDIVGNYKILGLAGAGGMGVVYRALDMRLERTVALKFLPEHAISSSGDKERFLREARFASALDHPNIGVIHGIEETTTGRYFIVMAYYTGETLTQKLRHGPLPLSEAVDIAIQMADGLAAAHAGTVVHRDIKPSNVILTQSGVPKIVDFGLARLASGSTGSTESLSTAGTIGYMSPEQTMGRFVDQRTDIWSLGTVLAEMVTGKNPFQRDTPAGTVFAILNEPPLSGSDLPIDLLRVIYRALSKDTETRYPNCREMVADLRDVRSRLEPATTQKTGPSSTRSGSGIPPELRKQIEQASRPMWSTTTATRTRSRWLAAIGALIVLLAAVSFLPPVRERFARWIGPPEEHIAVLPFELVGAGAGDNNSVNQAVLDGLMESMSSRLTNLETDRQRLWVVPASEVRRRKVTDATAALRELGATVVVEGTLRREGQMIRLTVNLVDTRTMRQIGSVPLEDRAGDFSSLEDTAIARLAKLMRIDVAPAMLATGVAVSSGAYESYLKALGYTQRYDRPGNLDLAINALQDAVKADPRFALGYAQMGEAYRLKYQLDKDSKWLEEALAQCQRAQQLDDRLPVAYVTLGHIHRTTGKYDLALQEYQRALQLDPRSADAVIGLAESYDSAGRAADAEAAYRKAIALRPESWDGYNHLGIFLDDHQRYSESIAQFRRAIELTPDNAPLYLNLGSVYIDMGDQKQFPEAERLLRKSIELGPTYQAYTNLGYLYIQERRYVDGAAAMEKAVQLNDKDYMTWGNLAMAYEGLNDKVNENRARDRQIMLLEQAVKDDPRSGLAQSLLALLYAKKKLHEKAISRIQSALVLSPGDPNVLENIGEAYEEMGDRSAALHYIEECLKKGYSLSALKNTPSLRGLLSDANFHVPPGSN